MWPRTCSGLVDDVVAGDDRPAAGRLEHGAQDPQRRGLARAVGPEQAEDLARAALERHVRDGADPAALVVEERLVTRCFNVDHATSPFLLESGVDTGPNRPTIGVIRPRPRRASGCAIGVDVFVEDVALPGDVAGFANARLISSSVRWWTVPAEETTFSSIIRLPMSLAPKNRPSWPILAPCVTQDDWMLGTLSR